MAGVGVEVGERVGVRFGGVVGVAVIVGEVVRTDVAVGFGVDVPTVGPSCWRTSAGGVLIALAAGAILVTLAAGAILVTLAAGAILVTLAAGAAMADRSGSANGSLPKSATTRPKITTIAAGRGSPTVRAN